MKIVRIAAAVILTALMLVIARSASRGHPEKVVYTENGYGFDMITVPKFAENSKARLDVKISGPLNWETRPVLRYARSERDDIADIHAYRSSPLIMADSSTGSYFAELKTAARGGRLQYYVQVVDAKDNVLATFMAPGNKPFVLKYYGDVPKFVLVTHIGLMFATVFCVAMAALMALSVIRGAQGPETMLRYMMVGTLLAILGGLPFGIAMNWFAFGSTWQGAPFGTDATDNKTQMLLVYLLFATVIGLGTLTNGKRGRDVFGAKAIGWFGFAALFIMLAIYLIPHSIQFSDGLTYGFCYSFVALWVLMYLAGWMTSRRMHPVSHDRRPEKVAR